VYGMMTYSYLVVATSVIWYNYLQIFTDSSGVSGGVEM